MRLIHVNTQEKYDNLMKELEEQGFEWVSGIPIKGNNRWIDCKEETIIQLDDGDCISYAPLGYYRRFPGVEIEEYKKGYINSETEENEMKEFKIGDRVRNVKLDVIGTVADVKKGKVLIKGLGYRDVNHYELVENSDNKVVVPAMFADYLKRESIAPDWSEAELVFRLTCDYWKNRMDNELLKWVRSNKAKAISAIMNGYEVEEEPLYYVKLPKMGSARGYVNFDKEDRSYLPWTKTEEEVIQTKFTEEEIKAIDERYWQFAVKVEEEDE